MKSQRFSFAMPRAERFTASDRGPLFAGDASSWSNDDIVRASEQAYDVMGDIIDPFSESVEQVFHEEQGLVHELNAQGWSEGGLTGGQIAAAEKVDQSAKKRPKFGEALANARNSSITTLGFAVTAKVQLIIGGEGGIGCVWDLLGRQGAKGMVYGCGKLGIEVGLGTSLQFLAFNDLPHVVEGGFYGVSVASGPISLIVFLHTSDLRFKGFSIGAGVQFGIGASVVGGGIKSFG